MVKLTYLIWITIGLLSTAGTLQLDMKPKVPNAYTLPYVEPNDFQLYNYDQKLNHFAKTQSP